MVSLAFHPFVVGTVIFASVLFCQVKKFFIPSNLSGVLCTETVELETTIPIAVKSYRDDTISL